MTLARESDRVALRDAIVKAATGLRLKAPPPTRADAGASGKVRVEVVQSMDQLRDCLALRKKVYGLMSYLPDKIVADPSGIEMDGYDIGRSTWRPCGAPRSSARRGSLRNCLPMSTRSAESASMRSTHSVSTASGRRRSRGGPASRTREGSTARSSRCRSSSRATSAERWAEMLEQTSPGAELSRLVGGPACRGLGISALLIRAVLAKAFQIHRRVLLLECIPTHVPMYARYGFKPLSDDPHSRPTDLDQFAVGMWCRLDNSSRAATAAEDLLAKTRMKLIPSFGPLDIPSEPIA